MIGVGSRVVKKSGKRFMNGEYVATVQGFTMITIPGSNNRYARFHGREKTEDAAILEGCEQPIRLSVIALAEQELSNEA